MSHRPVKLWKQWAEEGKALAASGDLDLDERRQTFARIAGRATTLDDEQLIYASMAGEPDGPDEENFVRTAKHIEQYGVELTDEQTHQQASSTAA